MLKAAYVEDCIYVGDQNLDMLVAIKSREELIGDIIGLLQSPAKNVISALAGAAGQKVAGIVKASRREEQLAEVLPASVQKETAATAA